VSHIEQISNPSSGSLVTASTNSNQGSASVLCVTKGFLIGTRSEVRGVEEKFGIIAAVLIVLWLLAFLAFHVSSALIHVLLVIGVVMLLLHFFRGRAATA
jgi:Family of unknown function (DUF5670)